MNEILLGISLNALSCYLWISNIYSKSIETKLRAASNCLLSWIKATKQLMSLVFLEQMVRTGTLWRFEYASSPNTYRAATLKPWKACCQCFSNDLPVQAVPCREAISLWISAYKC